MRPIDGAVLVIDGDDTLWEDTIYYERAIDLFIESLEHPVLDAREVRAVFDEVERENVPRYGYGIEGFRHSLVDCFARLVDRPVEDGDRARLLALAQQIVDQPVTVIEGVAETLAELAERHPLILFTMGGAAHQARKVDGSGLAPMFAAIEITAAKRVDDYRMLVQRHGLCPARTWMVGNSPRSDVIPALEAGLNAVLVPHSNTWSFEQVGIPAASERLIVLDRFGDLLERFP